MTPHATPLLEARNLVKQYGATRVVDDVSLQLYRGETLGLVGESGSGKSTVARMILRLIEPTSGNIIFHSQPATRNPKPQTQSLPSYNAARQPPRQELVTGDWQLATERTNPVTAAIDLLAARPAELRRLRRKIAIVFQDPYAALNPRLSVQQILAEPFAIHREQPTEGLQTRLLSLLHEVGLPSTALKRYPHEFSGGQRQRINIARALALRPELLVLDEPVSALDVSVAAQVINLLRDLQARHGLTLLFISHSMPLVRYLCQRVVVMQRGRIVETGTWSEVCTTPSQPYTQQLLAATPELPLG